MKPMCNEMASCNNQFPLESISQRCYSRMVNVTVEGRPFTGKGILCLFLVLGFCGALVLAKPASVQMNGAVPAEAVKDLSVGHRVEGKHSSSHKLPVQPDNIIGVDAANAKVKSTAASEGSRIVRKEYYELKQGKMRDEVEDVKSMYNIHSKTSQNSKTRGLGRVHHSEFVNSATSDLKLGRRNVPNVSENLSNFRPEDSHREVQSDNTPRSREALDESFRSRVKNIVEEEEKAGRGIPKDKSFNGGKTRFMSSRVKETDQLLNEELVRITEDGPSTKEPVLQQLTSISGSHEKHRHLKNNPEVIFAPANDRHNHTRTPKVKSPIFADVQGHDSDQISEGKSGDAVVQLPELEPEEVDETIEEKDLIPEYSLGEPVRNWDRERKQWLEDHPEVKPYTDDGRMRLFILTGTQPWPCPKDKGDHLLLRCFKNKVDYCRIHGIEIFYNMALLNPDMPTFWAKLPVLRATMLSHPEVEWVWWLDADAIITDMEFEIPLEKYEDYNMVVHGWESLVFKKKSWVSLNAGSFLIRNCQWSMDFMERWASMGPQGPLGEAYRDILSDGLPDRPRDPTDDQAALVYLMNAEKERWAGKIKVELEYYLNGYFVEFIDGFEAWEKRYREVEEEAEELREMVKRGESGKEKLARKWGMAMLKRVGEWGLHERRPFVTHFTGCQPCSGNHNPGYTKEQCDDGMLRALNYGDDQVLRVLGFKHTALHLPDLRPRPDHNRNRA